MTMTTANEHEVEVELKLLHPERGDTIVVTMPPGSTDLEISEAAEMVGHVMEINYPETHVLGMRSGIEVRAVCTDDLESLGNCRVASHTLQPGWYIERDDHQIQEGPFDTIHLARAKRKMLYGDPQYRVIWLEPEHRFIQP